ncbi:MAG: PRC-barrel domain-containing protein [Myxococcota bacterium]
MKTYKKMHGMQVATVGEGAIVGKLDDFQFDLESGVVYGFRLRGPGVFAKSAGVAADQLACFGRDLVLLKTETALEWGGERNEEEGRAWASTWGGTRVMTRRGAGMGQVEDFVLEADPPRVRALLLDGSRIVPLDGRVATGRDGVIVEDPAVIQDIPEDTEEETTDWWTRVKGAFSSDEKKPG